MTSVCPFIEQNRQQDMDGTHRLRLAIGNPCRGSHRIKNRKKSAKPEEPWTGHPLALSAAPASRPQRRRTCTGARPRARLAGGSLRGCVPCGRGGGRHARAAAARGPGEAGGPTRMQPMLRGGLASGRRVGRTAGPLPPSHFLPRPPSPSHPLAPPPAALPRGQPSLSRWSWVPGWAGQQ